MKAVNWRILEDRAFDLDQQMLVLKEERDAVLRQDTEYSEYLDKEERREAMYQYSGEPLTIRIFHILTDELIDLKGKYLELPYDQDSKRDLQLLERMNEIEKLLREE